MFSSSLDFLRVQFLVIFFTQRVDAVARETQSDFDEEDITIRETGWMSD